MTKSELIDRLAEAQQHLEHLDVELGVKSILEQMSASLSTGGRPIAGSEFDETSTRIVHDVSIPSDAVR